MVGENQQFIRSYWYLCVFPATGIATIMLAFTFWAMGCGTRWIRNSTSKGKGSRMQIDHKQVALLAERLHALGVGRREFLKVVGALTGASGCGQYD